MKHALLVLVSILTWGCGTADDPTSEPNSPPPTEPDELHDWLARDGYIDWESESDVLPGALGGGRRVFLNERLADSLAQGSGVHPAGSSAVRELYESDLETLRGWAVLIKVDETEDGNGWYFYESFDPDQPESINVAERGASGCTFCHEDAPDFVHSEYPLR